MKLYQISEIKEMMTCLFKGHAFDEFLVTEAELTTYATFRIDGTCRHSYFEDDSSSEIETERSASAASADSPTPGTAAYVSWLQLKDDLFALIRGRRAPSSMQLVLRLPDHRIQSFLAKAGLDYSLSDIAGLYLNIKLEDTTLTVTSGSSLRIFTLDRALEHAWDDAAAQLLRAAHISFDLIS